MLHVAVVAASDEVLERAPHITRFPRELLAAASPPSAPRAFAVRPTRCKPLATLSADDETSPTRSPLYERMASLMPFIDGGELKRTTGVQRNGRDMAAAIVGKRTKAPDIS